jgi:hypothetical protein
VTDFELRRADLPYALRAKADERIRGPFIDHEPKILNRSGPIGPRHEYVRDPLLRRQNIIVGLSRLNRGKKVPVNAVFAEVFPVRRIFRGVGQSDQRDCRAADRRLVSVFDAELSTRWKRLLPIVSGLERPTGPPGPV